MGLVEHYVQQLLREIDLAGNIDSRNQYGHHCQSARGPGCDRATPCGQIALPAKVGDACLNDFHHDAIRYFIGGQPYTAFMAHVEKLFPAGTQGNKGSTPVDVLSEMVIVLNSSWQVVWHYDAFDELNINRTAPLGETCSAGTRTARRTSSSAPSPTTGPTPIRWIMSLPAAARIPDSGDFLVSVRNQDQIDPHSTTIRRGCRAHQSPAPSCVGWYMGPPDGLTPSNFTFNNVNNDPWPWFSHQHDATYASNGIPLPAGGLDGPLLTIFDNGNTRYSAAPLG